mmetsp:Transcript_30887/g.80803  ORF Transcript_30887/g.80803 Transcript_30887/m.80803 type:complete len:141 (-) Transcript_30887:135-557(-)
MGTGPSKTTSAKARFAEMAAEAKAGEELVFKLAVSSGGCSGVYWRGDPRTGASPPDNADWPRNGALLKGVVHSVKGADHLQVTAQVPAGGSEWHPVSGGKWMPANGGAFNGGQWLHAPDREVPPDPAPGPAAAAPPAEQK